MLRWSVPVRLRSCCPKRGLIGNSVRRDFSRIITVSGRRRPVIRIRLAVRVFMWGSFVRRGLFDVRRRRQERGIVRRRSVRCGRRGRDAIRRRSVRWGRRGRDAIRRCSVRWRWWRGVIRYRRRRRSVVSRRWRRWRSRKARNGNRSQGDAFVFVNAPQWVDPPRKFLEFGRSWRFAGTFLSGRLRLLRQSHNRHWC